MTKEEEYEVKVVQDHLEELAGTWTRDHVAGLTVLAVRQFLKAGTIGRREAVAVNHLDTAWRWLEHEMPGGE